jgi:hypothetical protein
LADWRAPVDAPGHGLKQLARIVKIAAPQQRRAFGCQAESGIRGMRSSASTTRRGGGRPARDRQRAWRRSAVLVPFDNAGRGHEPAHACILESSNHVRGR